MFDVDGALVGYSGLAPEPLIELIAATRRGAEPFCMSRWFARSIPGRLRDPTGASFSRAST
jgi:4-hydroxy-tetrahydrodipicolinate synthase